LSGAVNLPIQLEGPPSQSDYLPQFLPILPDYFKTLEVTVVQGREFGPRDDADGTQVAVVNEAAAARFWPNESPLGKNIQIVSPHLPSEPRRQVIGVVTEVMQYSTQQLRPQLYVPYSQLEIINDDQLRRQLDNIAFIIRTPGSALDMASAIAAAVGRADVNQAISGVRTMQENAFAAPQRRGIFIALIALFGAIAVMLAVIGVYGVMSNVVTQRFNELGIRIALGANPGQIRRLVIRRGCILIGIGLTAGVAMSIAVTRVIRSFLFGTSATDPPTFAIGLILLGGVALLACYIPARRASNIDAIAALRHY
jgi:putative ABC transport system permease protein